jgi:hypothetical protein
LGTTDYGERIARVEVRVDEITHDLYGNGQPGILADLKNRLGVLETLKNKASGGVIVLIFLSNLLSAVALHLLGWK